MKAIFTRSRIALSCSVALLVALAVTPAQWHLPLGIISWICIRVAASDAVRPFGQLKRWLQMLVILVALGAVFAPSDSGIYGISLSEKGALSGVTMVVRAFALVAITSLATSVLPLRTWIEKHNHPIARRMLDIAAVAANLVPVQLRAIAVASANLKERRPGLLRLPHRLWLLAIHSALRAGMLAETVASDMAVADYNTQPRKDLS